MRILVAIANHGTKNLPFLQVLLDEYRSMRHDVDIVVISDKPKDLGSGIEVVVGAPIRDPWSLPFRHREIFAERVDDYDLFIYSEDDTLIRESNIDAFIEVNALLPDHQVPGFQRYELSDEGVRTISSIHSGYRWEPETVAEHGGEIFAAHTNLHAACYLLTQEQLWRAIGSGGYLVQPHAGLFDMLVTAGIDPYVQCGLERRLCVSRIEDFLVHHLPNRFVDRFGASPTEWDAQIDALLKVAVGELPRTELLHPRSKLATHAWDVQQYPDPHEALLEIVPDGIQRPLSVGATSGAAERAAFPDAEEILAIPIDAVIGAVAATRGVRVLQPDLDELEQSIPPNSRDAILLHHNLHHFPHPASLLERLRGVAAPGAIVIVGLRNAPYHRLRHWTRRWHAGPVPSASFEEDGVHVPGVTFLRRLERQGVVRWDDIRLTRSRRLDGFGHSLPVWAQAALGHEVYALGRLPA
jgi:SAM-dependent methyltransferase